MFKGVWRRKRSVLLTLFGTILFIIYLAISNPFKAFEEISKINISLYLLSILINDIGLVLFAFSWYLLLNGMGVKIKVMEAIQATFISLFVVWMIPIPVGSEIIRAYLVRDKKKSGIGKAVASVVVHKSMYNISFGIIITLSALITTFYGMKIPIRQELLWFVIFFALGSSILFAAILDVRLLKWMYTHAPTWIQSRLSSGFKDPRLGLNGLEAVLDEIGEAVDSLKSKIRINVTAFLMVAFHWSTGSITAYLVSLALGYPISFWLIVVIYAIVEFIQQLNIVIPGGLGIVDAGLTGAFVLLGIPLSMSTAISLLTRLATYWLEVILAGLISIHYGYKEILKDYLNGG